MGVLNIKKLEATHPKCTELAKANQLAQVGKVNLDVILSKDSAGGNFDWHIAREGKEFWRILYVEEPSEEEMIRRFPTAFGPTMEEELRSSMEGLSEEEKIKLLTAEANKL